MKSCWLPSIFLFSCLLMTLLKQEEQKTLKPYFKAQKSYKLSHFQDAKDRVAEKDLDLLELWESMLTGRSAPVARWIKDQYRILGLNHLFTPSGFHLSAVMLPFMALFKNRTWKLLILILLTIGILSLTGQGALKRMVLIKLSQHFWGQKPGFILALLLDIFFGSFNEGTLSFTYSFLFLGIIYSGSSFLILWFFIAQCLIAYFNGDHISPFILVLSPLLNFAFTLAMPLLFALAIPLADWQLKLGLWILQGLQELVGFSATLSALIPRLEINFGILICFGLVYFRRKRELYLVLALLSFNLNLDKGKIPSMGRYEFVPQGTVRKIIHGESGDTIYWSDGKCRRDLVRGIWWEKCSPLRRSTRKKPRKFSCLFEELRKSSLRG